MSYDLVINNATLYDGTGSAARHASVAIAEGKIAAVDGTSLHGNWINDLPGSRARIIERAEGFAYTVVGGQIVFDHGEYQGTLSGQVL